MYIGCSGRDAYDFVIHIFQTIANYGIAYSRTFPYRSLSLGKFDRYSRIRESFDSNSSGSLGADKHTRRWLRTRCKELELIRQPALDRARLIFRSLVLSTFYEESAIRRAGGLFFAMLTEHAITGLPFMREGRAHHAIPS